MKKLLFSLFSLTAFGIFSQHDSGVVTLNGSNTIRVQTTASNVTITATGPSDRWFGVGFGTSNMDGGDAIIFDSTGLSDRHFTGLGVAPTVDTNQWTVSSNTTVDMVRTIVATRILNTGDTTDFVFTNSTVSIPVVWSRHQLASNNLAYHGGSNRGSTTVSMALSGELFQLNQLVVYPNPVIDEVNISIPEINSKFNYSIYEITGKLMLSGTLDKALTTIDVKSFSSGSFVIHIFNDGIGSTSKTFIKK